MSSVRTLDPKTAWDNTVVERDIRAIVDPHHQKAFHSLTEILRALVDERQEALQRVATLRNQVADMERAQHDSPEAGVEGNMAAYWRVRT